MVAGLLVERISKKKKDMQIYVNTSQIYVNTSRYLCISIFRDLDTIVRAGIAREGLMFRSRWTLAWINMQLQTNKHNYKYIDTITNTKTQLQIHQHNYK